MPDAITKKRQVSQTDNFKNNYYIITLHNNNKTTFEFVVNLLMEAFGFNEKKALSLALNVHTHGQSIVGLFNKEEAYEKYNRAQQIIKNNKERTSLITIEQG